MQAGKFGKPIHAIQRDRARKEFQDKLARSAEEKAGSCSEIDTQAARAHGNASAEKDDRPLRMLMTHQRKSALQGESESRQMREQRWYSTCGTRES